MAKHEHFVRCDPWVSQSEFASESEIMLVSPIFVNIFFPNLSKFPIYLLWTYFFLQLHSGGYTPDNSLSANDILIVLIYWNWPIELCTAGIVVCSSQACRRLVLFPWPWPMLDSFLTSRVYLITFRLTVAAPCRALHLIVTGLHCLLTSLFSLQL